MADFINTLTGEILNPLIRLAFAVALVYFVYGVYKYIKKADSPEDRKEGARHIIWGIVGLFIMISVWAIISIALSTFGI